MRLTVIPLLCACLLAALASHAGSAIAADDPAGLDLALPQASTYRNDPPGTWYGDTSGVPPRAAVSGSEVRARVACPTAPDGQPRDLTGSVSAGMGYSSQWGNSNFQAADLNYCKQYFNDNGDARTINVQMHMGTYDGAGPLPGPWPGPRHPGPMR
jgi:hypothetical protein